MDPLNVTICTFNCRSVKSSIMEIKDLCAKSDFVCLQEHWLLPNEVSLLSQLCTDFLAAGSSAVDIGHDILVGRPYGGTAIMYRKSLSEFVTIIDTCDPRVTALMLKSVLGPVLLVSVYMPTDYGDSECFENYIATCAYITALFQDSDAVYLVVAGDFNCQLGSRFYDCFLKFSSDNKLQLTDLCRLKDVFTYFNDGATASSWIDHIVCSRAIDNLVSSCSVEYQYVSSDHKPLFVSLDRFLPNLGPSVSCVNEPFTGIKSLPDWSKCDEYCLSMYKSELDLALANINIPSVLFSCTTDNVSDNSTLIDNYYNDVISCINETCSKVVPCRKLKGTASDYIVPGWNDFARDKYDAARSAFLDWVQAGKPRQGTLNSIMRRTRAHFKLALRYCKQHEDTLRADALAGSLAANDFKDFWKAVRQCSNSKAANYAHVVDGCTGADAIADRWRSHFECLYNSVTDQSAALQFNERISANVVYEPYKTYVSVYDIISACKRQKLGKAVGPDNMAMEALINGTNRLYVHLAVLFNLFINYGHLPSGLMQSVIIPLVKNKSADLSDLNNYRAIAISPAVSKLFEAALEVYIKCYSAVENHQFGFKAGLSTSLCTNVLKQTVDYYTNRGSYVFACFIDFQKAFDKVNYWKLFLKLLDDGVNNQIVQILAVWYSKQVCYVRWQNAVSSGFHMGNGTRQGGTLSPYLFSRYIRELLGAVSGTAAGCYIGNHCFNILAYADDLVVLAPSWRGLQHLLNVLHVQSLLIDLTCNVSKTVCMVFVPKNRNRMFASVFPSFTFGVSVLQFVPQFKYLGHIISHNLTDDNDIQREIRSMFVRCNILIRKFSRCSEHVKLKLYQAYCLCFYDIALWTSFNVSSLCKFRSCYNKCMKLFFGYRKYDSVTSILLKTGLPSFDTICHNAKCTFQKRWVSCHNTMVTMLLACQLSGV